MNHFALLGHQNDVEVGFVEELALVSLPVVLDAGSLLNHRDGERVHVEVDRHLKREREESLGKWASVLGSKAVVELRVGILGCVILDANGCPGEVLQVVFKLDEELTVIFVHEVDLPLKLISPKW
jgi:hypothetical protein